MDLDEMLGIDPDDPMCQLAEYLVDQDHSLIDQLITLRKEQGLTQIDIAARLGVSQSSISGFERAGNDARLSTLRRYALAIGASITHSTEIVIHEPTKENDSAQEK